MKVSRADFDFLAERGIFSPDQAEAAWNALQERHPGSPFDLAHVMYYFGALLVMGAMTFFMTTGWAVFGGTGLAAIAVLYGISFLAAGKSYWTNGVRIVGGLLLTAAVCMVPLFVYGVQDASGLWGWEAPGEYRDFYYWIRSGWFFMEVATIAAGCLLVRAFPFPFLLFPVSVALYFLSMDLTPIIFGHIFSWSERCHVSIVFGLAMLVAAYVVDMHRIRSGSGPDFAFWFYLFGATSFWGGLSLLESGSEFGKALYCLINVVLMFISVLLERKIFIVYGSMGVFGYLGYLSYDVFADSLAFPFILSIIGICIIILGTAYAKHEARLARALLDALPPGMAQYLPAGAREKRFPQ